MSNAQSPFYQPKLTIGQPNDKYEKEADALADAVVNQTTAQPVVQAKNISTIQRYMSNAEFDEQGTNTEQIEENKQIQEKPEIQRKRIFESEEPLSGNDGRIQRDFDEYGRKEEKLPKPKMDFGVTLDLRDPLRSLSLTLFGQSLPSYNGIISGLNKLRSLGRGETTNYGFPMVNPDRFTDEQMREFFCQTVPQLCLVTAQTNQTPLLGNVQNFQLQTPGLALPRSSSGLRLLDDESLKLDPTLFPESTNDGLSSPGSLRTPGALQRKCADCENEKGVIQSKAVRSREMTAWSSLQSRLNASKGGGHSLPKDTQHSMSTAIGADFSKVRVHTDSRAVQMNKELRAQAFTHGSDVYFNSGKYDTRGKEGKRLLVHELTHVVQQNQQINKKESGGIIQSKPTETVTSCSQKHLLKKPRTSRTSKSRLLRFTKRIFKRFMACIKIAAKTSGTKFSTEIIDNTQKELDARYDYFVRYLRDERNNKKTWQSYAGMLELYCSNKAAEVENEFKHNIVFSGGIFEAGGRNPKSIDWNEFDKALSGMPDSVTRKSHFLYTITREKLHSNQSNVGGLAERKKTGRSDPASIWIYNAGVKNSNKYKKMSLTNTAQTLRHELAHIIETTFPSATIDKLFNQVIKWNAYSYAWASQAHKSPFKSWKALQLKLCKELGYVDKSGNCDISKLTPFLNQLKNPGSSIKVGSRTYTHPVVPHNNFITSIPTVFVPGKIWDYAKSNKSEYFAELYTYAVSNPQYIKKSLPSTIFNYLENDIFQSAIIRNTLGQSLAGNIKQQFLTAAKNLLTKPQMMELIKQLQTKLPPATTPLTKP